MTSPQVRPIRPVRAERPLVCEDEIVEASVITLGVALVAVVVALFAAVGGGAGYLGVELRRGLQSLQKSKLKGVPGMRCWMRRQVCCSRICISAGIGWSLSGASPPSRRVTETCWGRLAHSCSKVRRKPQHQLHMGSWI